MAILKILYTPFPAKDKITGKEFTIFKPLIRICLSFKHGKITNSIEALIDSGADRNLLPIGFGEICGISFKKIKPRKIMGIGQNFIDAYRSEINIWVNNEKHTTDADFSPQQQIPLLGREGFFSLFKTIKFNEDQQIVEIEFKNN